MQSHIQNTPACRAKWDREVERRPHLSRSESPKRQSVSTGDNLDEEHVVPQDDNFEPAQPFSPAPRRVRSVSEEPSEHQSKRARVEEVEDEDAPGRFYEAYPQGVADVLGAGMTDFEDVRARQASSSSSDNPWAPFTDEEEWELAEWLMKSTTQKDRDEFLKLPIVSLICSIGY